MFHLGERFIFSLLTEVSVMVFLYEYCLHSKDSMDLLAFWLNFIW